MQIIDLPSTLFAPPNLSRTALAQQLWESAEHVSDAYVTATRTEYRPVGTREILQAMLPIVQGHLSTKIWPTSTWSRVSTHGATLLPHTDQEGLDWAVSIVLDADMPWALEGLIDGEWQSFMPTETQGILTPVQEVSHRRQPFQGQRHVTLLLHYTEDQNRAWNEGQTRSAQSQASEKTDSETQTYLGLTPAGYNQFGEPLWINAKIALAKLGFENLPEKIGISRSTSVLEKAWRGLHEGNWDWPYSDRDIPTWAELVEAERLAVLDSRKEDTKKVLTRVAQGQIDAVCRNDLGLILPGPHTSEQIAECDRLHARAQAIHDMIEEVSTEKQLFSIDLRDNSIWLTP